MMKNFKYIALFCGLSFLFSCEKESYTNATVVKNCTGTYLRVLDKDYQVCNVDKTASLNNEQKVLVNFNLIKHCNNLSYMPTVCAMAHPSEGLINIINIKLR